MRHRLIIAGLAFFCLVCVPAWAAPPSATVLFRDGTDIYYLRAHAQMLEDRSAALRIDQVASSIGFGSLGPMTNASAAYWVRFSVAGERSSTKDWYLFFGYKPRFVDFYVPQANGSYRIEQSGNAVPYNKRPLDVYGWIAFALPVQTAPQTYYARIQTFEPNLTIAVDSSPFFWHQNQQQLLMIVGLGCVLLTFALSSLILFGLARRSVYIYYAAYLVAQFLYRANDVGVAAAYFWPGSALSWTQLEVFFDGLTVLTATLFVRKFLHTRQLSPWLDRVNIGVAVIAGACTIAALLYAPFRASWIWNFDYVYVAVWLLSGIIAWRAGEEQAKFFLMGWLALMAGILAADVKQLGVGNTNFVLGFVLSHGPYFGIAIQSTFLSLALAMELRQLASETARFRSLAITDTVTEIANRRVFDERMRMEWMRALRNGTPVTILIVDVDFFKPYNDQYGHTAGDFCLRAVAQAGTKCMMRPGDVFCRFGGEEFAAVLPETDREGGLVLAESIRKAIEDLHITHERSSAGIVTVSVGVAAAAPSSQNSAAGILSAADDALYRAKANGRNRVVADNYESAGSALSMT